MPVSIGSRKKAREYLEDAATLAPDDPENILNLIETYLKWDDLPATKEELKTLDALWPQAQKNFTGPAWEQDWNDWSQRRDALRRPAASPVDVVGVPG